MPGLNHKGPENQGPRTGRGLGKCNKNNLSPEQVNELGVGMGLRRRCNSQSTGLGKRRQSGFNN